MLLQRSKLAAATVERPRLAPIWSIAVLGVLVLGVLIGIFPHKALVQRVLEAPQNDITEAYLINLLRTEPDSPQLGLMLARFQLNSGQISRVDDTLAPLLAASDQATRLEATWLNWQVMEHRYRRLADDAPERPKAKAELRQALASIADNPWSIEILGEIARKAIAFGELKLGLSVIEQLGANDQNRSAFWYSEAARTALADGEYRASAEFFLIARGRAQTLPEQREYFISALLAMQSGNLVRDALTMAEEELATAPVLAESPQILELLVRFARAAQRPDLADKYARKLLRLSLLEQWQRQQLALSGFDATVRHVALEAPAESGGPGLPFDDRIYTLGFEAFLDNRKLEDAWKVASSAVRQAPDALTWRERLAKVSEWSGRPKLALDNWLYLARKTGRDDAWQAVLRLAPGLFDDDALLAALQYQLSRNSHDEKLTRELSNTFERLGDPQGALRFLEASYQRLRQAWLIELMAEVAERSGDEARAIEYWRRFLGHGELTPARAVRIATLMLLRGQTEEALSTLEKAATKASENDTTYWRLTGDLARQVQQEEKARSAYRRVIGTSDASEQDFESLAILLLEQHPLEAARVYAASWTKFRSLPHMIQALTHFAASDAWLETGRLLKTISGAELQHLRTQSDFLRLSAQYHLNTGNSAMAQRDLEAAVRLAAGASDVPQALLWLLIEAGDGTQLRRVLSTWEPQWRNNPEMHDALAAAYLAMSLPDLALRRYLTPHLSEHRNNFLWMMNYADALDQNQETDRAWRLRQYLLAEQRQQAARSDWLGTGDTVTPAIRRAARARLIISQHPGDPAYKVLRDLLRLDRDAQQQLSPSAKDLALGWMIDREEFPAARGWLWQQYARTASRPRWAEISLALQANDRETAGQLLERHGELLPLGGRIGAARLVGDTRRAQTEAFEAQEESPAEDQLHLQLTEALLAHSDHAGGKYLQRDIGKTRERELAAAWHVALSPRLSIDLALGSIARSNGSKTTIGTTPDETYRSARVTWQHADGETRLTTEDRESFDHYRPVLLEHEHRFDDRLSAILALGTHQTANESEALRVAGMSDRARVALRYRPTQRDQVSIEHIWDQYSAQTGTDLGSGRAWQLEFSHTLHRNLEASIFWSDHRYSQRDIGKITDPRLRPLLPEGTTSTENLGADFFVPNDFSFKGIRLSTDTHLEHDYTRAWRPYAAVARTWHSTLSRGYDLSAGISGSVFGADHLSFGWKLGRGGTTTGGLTRELGFTYRLHF